jgi:hypothetical protein
MKSNAILFSESQSRVVIREVSLPLTEAEKEFTNSTGYWEHDGGFSVELAPGAPVERVLPASARWDGLKVHVHNGRVKQTMGGIQLYGRPNLADPFYFSYKHIICIRKADGSMLWRNYNVK